MNHTRVDGPGVLPDGIQSEDTTLEDLLNDDSLGYSPGFEATGDIDDRHFEDCLAMFIKGDREKSLQKMYEYGFLAQESLRTSYRYFDLFLEACSSIDSFRGLGFRLQEIIRQTFTGDVQIVQEHLSNALQKPHALFWNQYYSCCVKASLMDGSTDQGKSLDLENGTRKTISRLSRDGVDTETAAELEMLVETYIFGIQIEVLRKPRSGALYRQLCYQVPHLADQLASLNSMHKGKKIDEYILSRLETKPSKSKKQPRQHCKSVTDSKPVASMSRPPLPRTRETNAVQVISKWRSLWSRYFSKVHLSGQNLLFLMFCLLVSLQSIKKLAKVPRFFAKILRMIMPQLKNIVRLLSSI